jgi:CheY-like chemotaxis protein/HPt (histidine-containing phosphotransfer) domain-containing protein
MTVVVGMTDLLLLSAKDAEQKHLLQSVKQASEVMLRMLDEAVDFSRLEAGSLLLDERQLALAEVTRRASESLAEGPAPIRLSVSIDPAVPSRVFGDATRLQQLVEALARSSVKLRSTRDYDLHVSAERITSGVRLQLLLSEHGRPLDAASAAAKVESLRLADFAERGFFGAGLGLQVVAGLAELMGGGLGMAAEPASPIVFRAAVCVGLADGRAADLLAAVEQRLDDRPQSINSLKVLLAEDTTANRQFFRTALEKRGHSVVAVANGQEALQEFQSTGDVRAFDVVVLDVEMPVLGGREAAAKLRTLKQFADRPTPLIALTAHQTQGDCEFSIGGPFDAAITKPCELARFYEVIEALARGAAPPAPPSAGGDTLSTERIDYRGTLRRLDGNEQLFNDLCRFFLEDVPGVLAKLRASLGREDAEGVERAAHSAKGLVANFGAKEAIELAAELQSLGHQRSLNGALPIYQRLEKEVDLMRHELHAYRASAR